MKILMLGWELPPRISGGLGVASQGIADGLAQLGHDVTFFLPKKRQGHSSKSFKIIDASRLKLDEQLVAKKKWVTQIVRETELGTRLVAYLEPEIFAVAREKQVEVETVSYEKEEHLLEKVRLTGKYLDSLHNEIAKYSLLSAQFAAKKSFDLIYAHDWVTFRAGMVVTKETGLPLFLHCHSTEYDRNGIYAQQAIIDEEKKGFKAAKKIFCVSNQLKQTIVSRYSVDAKKLIVVPNASDQKMVKPFNNATNKKQVVFMGRFTHQKDPKAFVDLARDLVSRGLDCEFTMVGDGYLNDELKFKIEQNNLTSRFKLTGFISRDKALSYLKNADLLVTPSNSEPFGLVILEAIMNGIPVVAARGVGISEFIPSLPQVDKWDNYNQVKLAEKLLTDESFLKETMESCQVEAKKLNWQKTSKLIQNSFD